MKYIHHNALTYCPDHPNVAFPMVFNTSIVRNVMKPAFLESRPQLKVLNFIPKNDENDEGDCVYSANQDLKNEETQLNELFELLKNDQSAKSVEEDVISNDDKIDRDFDAEINFLRKEFRNSFKISDEKLLSWNPDPHFELEKLLRKFNENDASNESETDPSPFQRENYKIVSSEQQVQKNETSKISKKPKPSNNQKNVTDSNNFGGTRGVASPIFLENTLMEISYLQDDLDTLDTKKRENKSQSKEETEKYKDEEKTLRVKIDNLKEKLHERRLQVKNRHHTQKSKRRFRRRF